MKRLAADGVAVVFDDDFRVIHWGADPGALPAAADFGLTAVPLLPTQHDGWSGRPAVTGHRDGSFQHLRFARTGAVSDGVGGIGGGGIGGGGIGGGGNALIRAFDPGAGVEIVSELTLTAQGVVTIEHTLRNVGESEWSVAGLHCLLPVPDHASHYLDLTGRWSLERVPQRGTLGFGVHSRENRRGRTGHDSTTILSLGTPGFANRIGQVWSVHAGWSGNHEHRAERLPDSTGVLGGGELLEPGEVRLGPGETYTTPTVYFVFSESGLDGVRDRFHRFLRARGHHPRTPRPVVLNTWEAVYFDHDLGKLKALADKAAEVGVERFVLDDGWFRHRRDDRAGLGDWYVDEGVWPGGLHPLVGHVRGLGMQFGLWFEPEMINPDSDLAREHPEWILALPGRMPGELRNQQVLDLARPDAYAYLLERIDSLVREYRIDFIKWDHNRDLVEAPGVHEQTLAVYRLLDELRSRHPELEIESCSSGGARIDLGILERTDRVWTSDTNDPIDRQQIQLWTGLLLPPELIGAHVGPARTHITGRVTDPELRCATALFGHAGIEQDLTACTAEELTVLREWIRVYKASRELLHGGTAVTPDLDDPSAVVHGVVAADRTRGMFCYAQISSPVAQTPLRRGPMRLRLPGLDPDREYVVSVALKPHAGEPTFGGVWSGRAIETVGLPVPRLNPADALVLEFRS